MSHSTNDVDAYLASVPDKARATLEKLRSTIRAAAPGAEEVISYRVPTFKLRGPLVAFSAHDNHCSLHLMSPPLMAAIKDDLRGYDTTKATIHFMPARPLPAALVKKLVEARIAENEARVTK